MIFRPIACIITILFIFQNNCLGNILISSSLAKHKVALDAFESQAQDVTVIVTRSTTGDKVITETTYEPMTPELIEYIDAEKQLYIALSANTGIKAALVGLGTGLFEELAMRYSLCGKSLLDKKAIVANTLAGLYIVRAENENNEPIAYIDTASMKAKKDKLSDISIQRLLISLVAACSTHAITRLAFRIAKPSTK